MTRRSFTAILSATLLLLAMTAGSALAARQQFTFQTTLTPDREIPIPMEQDAIGHATVMIRPDSGEICWIVRWNRIDDTVIHAHIHGPLTTLPTASPIVGFFMNEQFPTSGMHKGCVINLSAAEQIIANPQLFYVNVHSEQDPPGAIRGSLSQTPSD